MRSLKGYGPLIILVLLIDLNFPHAKLLVLL